MTQLQTELFTQELVKNVNGEPLHLKCIGQSKGDKMNNIIKIEKQVIGAENINSVNARELYNYLGVKKDFSDWIKVQIERAGFEKDVDYITLPQKGEKLNSGVCRPRIEYIITLDTAKHIAMMSGVAKGKEVRNYFIEVEKQATKPKTLSLEDLLIENTKMISNLQNKVVSLETQNQALEITNSMLMHTNKLYTATEIAKELGLRSANILNKKLEDLKIQYKTNDCWVLNSRYSQMGYTSTKQQILENGKIVYDRKFTQKGREFLLKLFAPSYIIRKQDLQNNKISKYEFKKLKA